MTDKIISGLFKAREDMGLRVKKNAKNPHFRSDYANLEAVLDVIDQPLRDQNLLVIQEPTAAEGGIQVNLSLWSLEGERMDFAPIFVPVNRNDAQAVGSAITYARRYQLMAVFGLAPSDDDGNAAAASPPKGVHQPNDATPEQKVKAIDENLESITAIKEALAKDDLYTAYEVAHELDDDTKKALWGAQKNGGAFTTEERRKMKTTEWYEIAKQFAEDKAA